MSTTLDLQFRSESAKDVLIEDTIAPRVLDAEFYSTNVLRLTGSLTDTRELRLPHENGPNFRGWIIGNMTNQPVRCIGATGDGTVVPAGSWRSVFSDGVDFHQLDASASGGDGGVSDHGALTGLLDNDHPQYQLAASAIPTTRQILAGAGCVGGGDLSADRTINVGAAADGSISVTADAVGVGVLATDAQHGARGGGTTHAVATTGAAGFMSSTDKAKLDGIPSGGGGVPAPTAANQVYNSTGASAAAWTDDPVVDTVKALTSAEVGTYAATAAAGNGANSALVAQGGGAGNGNGGYMALCGGIPNGTGSGGGSGLASRGDASGLLAGTICVSAEEVGGRKCAALLCASQLTSTVFPTGAGDGVIVIGRCITYPTTGPATSYGLAWVGNGLGNNGVPIRASADGLAYSNAIRKTVAAGVTATFSLGNLAGTAQYGPSPNNYRMGAAMGMIHIAALGNSSGWTATGTSQFYWKSGFFASHYNGSGPSGPWLAYLDNTTIPTGSLIALAVDSTTFEVTLTVKNTNATSIDIHVYYDWKQSW